MEIKFGTLEFFQVMTYSYGPNYKTRPVDLPDPYETKFTAKTVNVTAQIRGKRGLEVS